MQEDLPFPGTEVVVLPGLVISMDTNTGNVTLREILYLFLHPDVT
jgi:hypothetical protein